MLSGTLHPAARDGVSFVSSGYHSEAVLCGLSWLLLLGEKSWHGIQKDQESSNRHVPFYTKHILSVITDIIFDLGFRECFPKGPLEP